MVIFLSIVSMLLIASLVVSVKFNLRFGKMLVNIEDNLQDCLDRIDIRYNKLVHVFDDTPGTMTDDPFVRNFLNEVSLAKEDLIIIANILARGAESVDEIIGDDENSIAPGKTPDVVQSEKE